MVTAKVCQLLERSEENIDRLFNHRHFEQVFGSDLFGHFLDVAGARPLFDKLQDLASKFLSKLYPKYEQSVHGQPRFTFDMSECKITGFHNYSKHYGVSKPAFSEVSVYSFFF